VKRPDTLMSEAQEEAYRFFDEHIRSLPTDSLGKVLEQGPGFSDNAVDAFRHADVSGVFTQEYNETAADLLGRQNELKPADLYSNSRDPRARNMDLWNNAIGRKYGLKCATRSELLQALRIALQKDELIISLEDPRKYEGATNDPRNESKPIIVLRESDQGRNEIFFDIVKREVMTTVEFVSAIQAGRYPGYTVKTVAGIPTPVSKPDRRKTNNLA
jgi:hypothetical protein